MGRPTQLKTEKIAYGQLIAMVHALKTLLPAEKGTAKLKKGFTDNFCTKKVP